MIRDIHTHHLPVHPDEAIISYYCSSHSLTDMNRAVHLSAGIHPWFLTEEDITLQLAWLDTLLEDKRLLAIGEVGLDKCCHTPFALQQKAFEAQIICSEHRDLPMILHIVRAYQELIAYRKSLHARQPWIIHGFRGKKEVARTLLDQGFTSPSDRNSNRKPCVTYRKTVSYWRQTSLYHLSVKSIRRQPQPVRRP